MLSLGKKPLIRTLVVIITVASLTYYLTSNYYTSLIRSLEEEYADLKMRHALLVDTAKKMNESLGQVASILKKYCCLPRVFPEVLNKDEVVALKWYIVSIGVDTNDDLKAIEQVFNWVVKNVKYVGDPWVVLPDRMAICTFIGNEQYCFYEFRELRDYVQSPTETLRRSGGDCEDHAILVYAMLYYYFRYMRGVNYTIWLAFMSFGDGSKHASVFIPVSGGGLIIVDTSAEYITRVNGTVAPRTVMEELQDYSYLFIRNGGISRINLYSVDIDNVEYNLLVSGGLATIASYIERYIAENHHSAMQPKR